MLKRDENGKTISSFLSLLSLSLSPPLSPLIHIRPADLAALQPPDGLPQALVDGADGVDNRHGLPVLRPVGFRAVFPGEPAPEGAGHAEVDAGADVEVEDVARVRVGLFFVFRFFGAREKEREKWELRERGRERK